MASESVLQYLGRCRPSDFDPVAMLVMLPPSEYAEAKAKTLRTGTHTTDFDDEDGLCHFFIRDGDLHPLKLCALALAAAAASLPPASGFASAAAAAASSTAMPRVSAATGARTRRPAAAWPPLASAEGKKR